MVPIYLYTARFLLAAGDKRGAMAALTAALAELNRTAALDYLASAERRHTLAALSYARRC